MAERVQKQKSNSERASEEVVSSVLESNAEDFVKSYIQKGGE